jgi:hypothetical protein
VRYYRPYRDVVASPIGPVNTAFEPHLYSLSGVPIELRASVETRYMTPHVDTPASDALARLLASDLPNMNDREKRGWARFLMSLALRNPDTVTSVNAEMRQQILAQLVTQPEAREAHKASGERQSIEAWLDDSYPEILDRVGTLNLPLFIEELSKPFHAMRWFTLDLGGSATSLLMGDRPLIDQYGFGDPRYVIALPISPRFLFVAANTRETLQSLVSQNADTVVAMINELIVMQATMHVYGNTKAHLAFVEENFRPART